MDKRYRVVFERCGEFVIGDVVLGRNVARSAEALEYLLRVGAIETVAAKGRSADRATSVKGDSDG
jgi:hypothetical protein